MASKVVKDMNEDFLNCCICMTNFKTPKMLPCIHSFCEGCLEKYAAKDDSDQIPCPTCRKVYKLPETGVKGLPTNFHLINLAERVNLLEKLTSTTKKASACDSCKSPEVVAFCVNCNFAICSKCQHHHSLFPLLSSHSVIPLNQLNDPKFQQEWRHVKSPYCQLHSSEKLHFYCNTCSQMICRDCTVVLHAKPDHEYVEASSKFENIKEDLIKRLESSKELLEKELLVLQRGVKGYEQMGQEKTRMEAELSLHCKKTVAAIEAELDELKDAIVAKFAERVHSAEVQIQYAENWVKRMQNTQEITQTVIQENNPWELLAMSADLSAAFEELKTDSKSIELEPSDLKGSTTFQPSLIPDLQLGEVFCFPADAVVTDGRDYFFLCDFNKSNKMLSIMRVSRIGRKLEYFLSYEWKDDYPPGAKLVATVCPSDCIIVGLGKILVKFSLGPKAFSVKREVNVEGRIQCITYNPHRRYFYIADADEYIHCYNSVVAPCTNFRLGTVALSIYTYAKYMVYNNEDGDIKCWNTDYNRNEDLNIHIQDQMTVTDTSIVNCIDDGTYVFYILQKGSMKKVGGKGDNERGTWVLQELSINENKPLGILECPEGGTVNPPKAVLHREASDGMWLHLCDECGKVTTYMRGVYEKTPLKYAKIETIKKVEKGKKGEMESKLYPMSPGKLRYSKAKFLP